MCETETRLEGKVAVVTGGSSGIGFEAAKNLANRGTRVIIASRSEKKLQHAKTQIVQTTGNHNVAYKILDLGSLKSVRNFANEINTEDRIDILVNNAGAISLPDKYTPDGLNLTMQVNFFGVFLLTYLLLPKLKASAPSRIINGVASSMYFGVIDFNHWNDINRYNFMTSIANSKLAMALFSAELNQMLKDSGVTVNTFDPFVVKGTDILNNIQGITKHVSQFFIDIVGQNKEDVGKQIAYLAAAAELQGVSGKHYKFCRTWLNHWLVNDKTLTKYLWKETKKFVKISRKEDWELKSTYFLNFPGIHKL